MMHVYMLETSAGLEEAVKQLKAGNNAPFILVGRDFCAFRALLEYSLLQAYKSFQRGENKARSLDLEWLRFLAASRNVSQALAMLMPKTQGPQTGQAKTENSTYCVASPKDVLQELKKLGKAKEIIKPTAKELETGRAWLAKAYRLPKAATENYSAERLVQEKIAVAAID
ncbi:MAG: KEOPS complex subunit Cgi121 [Candidatus Micrarchaeia archaeon]|jgi:tRNA threonylcarbamoyladenosine modification (KEOPS) complex Cgi121 subunit